MLASETGHLTLHPGRPLMKLISGGTDQHPRRRGAVTQATRHFMLPMSGTFQLQQTCVTMWFRLFSLVVQRTMPAFQSVGCFDYIVAANVWYTRLFSRFFIMFPIIRSQNSKFCVVGYCCVPESQARSLCLRYSGRGRKFLNYQNWYVCTPLGH